MESLEDMDVGQQVAKLMQELSSDEGHVIQDGASIMTCMLLEEAEKLLERGLKPVKIAQGFGYASHIAVDFLQQMSRNEVPNISAVISCSRAMEACADNCPIFEQVLVVMEDSVAKIAL